MAFPFTASFRDGKASAARGIISDVRSWVETRPIVDDWEEDDLNFYRFGTLVQTDSRMHTSCSGGALLDLEGRLVGMTTAVGGTTGLETAGTLAVPFNPEKWRVVDVLRRGEEAEHGFLGINFKLDRFRRFRANQQDAQARIGWVLGNSPASCAGLEREDLILAINDQPVSNVEAARRAIGALLCGSQARLKVQSWGGEPHVVVATLTKAYHVSRGIASHRQPPVHGLRVDYTSVLSQRYSNHDPGIPDGVVVTEVTPRSPAAAAQLQEGRRITKVNGRAVNSPPEFYQAARQADREGRARGAHHRRPQSKDRGPDDHPSLICATPSAMRLSKAGTTPRFAGSWPKRGTRAWKSLPSLWPPRSRSSRKRPGSSFAGSRKTAAWPSWACTGSWRRTEGLQITAPDPASRHRTALYLVELARCCGDLGGTLMVFGSPAQRKIPTGASREQAMDFAVDTFRQALPGIAECGVRLCLEPLSPPEADFINTAAEAVELLDRVGHPNFHLHLDVKAMATEEASVPELIRRHAARLAHFHANDVNRRGPGSGSTDFVPIFRALRNSSYNGWVSVEVFDYTPDPQTIARSSLRYMQECERQSSDR